jgi:hypothetical protein
VKYSFLCFPSSFFWQNTTVKYGKELHPSRIVWGHKKFNKLS